MMKLSIFFIILSVLLITHAAPQHELHLRDRSVAYNAEISHKRAAKRFFEAHSSESSEDHSDESGYHHHFDKNHDKSTSSEESDSSSVEHKIRKLNRTLSENSNKVASSTSSSAHSKDVSSQKPEVIPTDLNNSKPIESTKAPETTQTPPQDQNIEDIFSVLDQTTPTHPEDILDPVIIKNQKTRSRKRRFAHSRGFSYGYTIYHYNDPYHHEHKPIYWVPLHTSYSYVPYTPSPFPKRPDSHPTIYHGDSDGNNNKPSKISTKNPEENAVVPLETTTKPTEGTSTDNSNNIPSLLEETDSEEVFKGTEMPDSVTEVSETTDNVLINLFGIE
jgi:hypothetical protein